MIKKLLTFITLIFAFTTVFINHLPKLEIKNLTLNIEDDFNKLGYESEDIVTLNTTFTQEQIEFILQNKIKKAELFPYLKYKSFNIDFFENYEAIRIGRNLNHLETINIYNHPDMMSNFYNNIKEAINQDTNLILVNKNYFLHENFIPKDLVFPEKLNLLIPADVTRNLVKPETYAALIQLFNDARNHGLYLYLSNGYRSYEKQERLYNEYLIEGSHADDFSARAGHSEHQTGLAVDLTAKSVHFLLIEDFGNTKEGKFVQSNAYKYGFIIRYPKDREQLTGYKYEPWHLRYVGKEAAETITKQNLILEEYLLKYTEIIDKQT